MRIKILFRLMKIVHILLFVQHESEKKKKEGVREPLTSTRNVTTRKE
jgi:hypothetical protein